LIVLEAAGFDPLRAQEMEEILTEEWWRRYYIYRVEYGKVLKERERKLGEK
jgi:hypothetical protein